MIEGGDVEDQEGGRGEVVESEGKDDGAKEWYGQEVTRKWLSRKTR